MADHSRPLEVEATRHVWREELLQTGKAVLVPSGNSMWPMIRGGRDTVEIHRLEAPAKRYDLVLYFRGAKQQGVLHRVLEARDGEYIIAGDNTGWKETVPSGNVVGIVTRFCRKGKWHDVNERGYGLYVRLWTDLYRLRSPVQLFRDRVKGKLKRMRNREA